MNGDSFLEKWSVRVALNSRLDIAQIKAEMKRDLESIEPHFFEWGMNGCNCQQCDPKPIFESK